MGYHGKKYTAIQEVSYRDSQLPISESAAFYKQPFIIDVSLQNESVLKEKEHLEKELSNTKRWNIFKKAMLRHKLSDVTLTLELLKRTKLKIAIRQLLSPELSVFIGYVKQIKELLLFESQEAVYLQQFPFLLSNFCTIENPELIIEKEILEILYAKHKEQLREKHYESLAKAILKDKWSKNVFEKKVEKLKSSSLEFLIYLSENVLKIETTNILLSFTAPQLVFVANKVIEYNDIETELKKKDPIQP